MNYICSKKKKKKTLTLSRDRARALSFLVRLRVICYHEAIKLSFSFLHYFLYLVKGNAAGRQQEYGIYWHCLYNHRKQIGYKCHARHRNTSAMPSPDKVRDLSSRRICQTVLLQKFVHHCTIEVRLEERLRNNIRGKRVLNKPNTLTRMLLILDGLMYSPFMCRVISQEVFPLYYIH